MEFLGVLMGFSIGIYLMEIETSHVVTRKILAAIERRSSHPRG